MSKAAADSLERADSRRDSLTPALFVAEIFEKNSRGAHRMAGQRQEPGLGRTSEPVSACQFAGRRPRATPVWRGVSDPRLLKGSKPIQQREFGSFSMVRRLTLPALVISLVRSHRYSAADLDQPAHQFVRRRACRHVEARESRFRPLQH